MLRTIVHVKCAFLYNFWGPLNWKSSIEANVTPIHKSSDKSLPKNYRPISVTPILCRLLETIVREVIVQHIKTNDIIINQQYGFREKEVVFCSC